MTLMTSIVMVTLAAALEFGAFLIWGWPFFAVGDARWTGLVFHWAACAALYLAWLRSWRHPPADAKSLFQILMAFFFPGVGWVLAVLLRMIPSLSSAEVRTLQEMRDSRGHPSPGAVSSLTTVFSKEVQPVADVLAGKDLALKREAIRRLALRAAPSSVLLLRQALLDPNGEIRLYAVNALQRLERQWVEAIERAQKTRDTHPDVLSAHLDFGRAYQRFAESGLLEPMLVRLYRQKALRALEKARMLFPERPESWAACLEQYVTLEQPAYVNRFLPMALIRFPNDPGLLLIEARFAFAKGEWRRVMRAVQKLKPMHTLSVEQLAVWPI